jgi:hypothetical protein
MVNKKVPGLLGQAGYLLLGCFGFDLFMNDFLSVFWVMVFGGTTACEKPLFHVVFVFEHFFYSSASLIL